MEDVISTHYPKRPDNLDDLCLHDFVAGTQKIVGVNECTENLQSRGSSTDPQKEHPEGRILLLSIASVCALQERSLFAQRKRDCRGSIQSSLACQ